MEGFFAKYSVALDEWNAVDKIIKTANKVSKAYDAKDEKKYLCKLAYLYGMVEDFFEAKGEKIEDFQQKP